jgi:hypothetical protein
MAIEVDVRELIEDNSLTPYTSRKDDVVKTEEVTEPEHAPRDGCFTRFISVIFCRESQL